MRVVLDTNVILSAFLFGGRLTFITDLIARGAITPCFSYITWRELERTLTYPHLADALRHLNVAPKELLIKLEVSSVFVEDILSPISILDDPADEAILACALSANAHFLVTGDKHLLKLAARSPVAILTPQQFRVWWNK